MTRAIKQLQHHATKAYGLLLSTEAARRRYIVSDFAAKFGLVYFKAVNDVKHSVPVLRGVTAGLHQRDEHFCLGSHDGYDMVYAQRVTQRQQSSDATAKAIRYHLMEFDLHTARDLPMVVVVSRQMTHSFYEDLLLRYRQLRMTDPALLITTPQDFARHYIVLASPSELPFVHSILDGQVSVRMSAHQEPFSLEIQGDSLTIFTENPKTSLPQLTKMLHYGIWLAKHIDTQIK